MKQINIFRNGKSIIELLRPQSHYEATSEKALTDSSKFVFGLMFRPLFQGPPQRIWEAVWGSTVQ